MNKQSKIFVAGATGLVGSAIVRNLLKKGYNNILGTFFSRQPQSVDGVRYVQLNLLDQQAVEDFYNQEKPEYVFLAAAKVGGIKANHIYRGEFIYENLQIQNNVIHQAYLNDVTKLLFLGSSCIYPKNAPQPMKEEHLLTSELEYTNEPYAIAKIAGMKMCEDYNLQYGTNFISVMPTNLYGPNDNYHLENSHVLAALIRKNHLAKALENKDFEELRRDFGKHPVNGVDSQASDKQIRNELENQGIHDGNPVVLKLWGSGKPHREFLHSDDLADASTYLMETIDFSDVLHHEFGIDNPEHPMEAEVRNSHINIGTGKDISIQELAETIQKIVGFRGEIRWDTTKPDGTYRKLLDVSRLNGYGWFPKISFKQGLESIYEQYRNS